MIQTLNELPFIADSSHVETTYTDILPSGRSLQITYTPHPDGPRITKYEYMGSAVSCLLSNILDKNRDFLLHVVTGMYFTMEHASFNSKDEARQYITEQFHTNIHGFNRYKKKPKLEQVLAYIESLSEEEIRRIQS
jgi:hypothetical protein